jgi:hypothetical protein
MSNGGIMSREGRILRRLGPALLTLVVCLAAVGSAEAAYVIEFTNGHKVTVSSFVHEGGEIKVYTAQGTVRFRAEDVLAIRPAGAGEGTTLEAVWASPPARPGASLGDPTGDPARTDSHGQADRERQGPEASGRSDAPPRPQVIEAEYREVAQRIDEKWQQLMRKVGAGASEDELAATRRELDELGAERHRLIEAIREAQPEEDLPPWAR